MSDLLDYEKRKAPDKSYPELRFRQYLMNPSSFIQTILSALEFHQIMHSCEEELLAGYTAGGELHPALKTFNIYVGL